MLTLIYRNPGPPIKPTCPAARLLLVRRENLSCIYSSAHPEIAVYAHLVTSEVKVVPGCVVVELVQQSVSQHGSVLIYKDVLTAVNTDQQADDV